jgi:putative DNA primase/helicase
MRQGSWIDDVKDHATGRWRGILLTMGIGEAFLTGKNGPCPMCGGTDRWRWLNSEGRGTWVCTRCGAGDGWRLLELYKGWDFKTAVKEVREALGIVDRDPRRHEATDEQKREWSRRLWMEAVPITKGDPVDLYLEARGVGEPVSYAKALRFHPSCRFSDSMSLPAMLAILQTSEGKGSLCHRTFLSPDGRKADVIEPKKIMPGKVPPGSAIRLGAVSSVLGVAEGIETALAALHRFEHPVWALVSTSGMQSWMPPEGVEEVPIYADHDKNHAGFAAAFHLSKSLLMKGIASSVVIPPRPGSDWADYTQEGYVCPIVL